MKVFLLNTIILIVTSLIFRIIDIYFTSYVSKKIGAEMLGIYQLIMSVYLFGITLATSGINLTVTRIVSEELAIDNFSGVKKVMKKVLYICLGTSILASMFFYLNTDFIIERCLHNKVHKSIIYLICLALPLITMSSAIAGYFAGVRRIYKNAIGQFIEHIGKVMVTAYLISLFLPNGLNYACFALILGTLYLKLFLLFIFTVFIC